MIHAHGYRPTSESKHCTAVQIHIKSTPVIQGHSLVHSLCAAHLTCALRCSIALPRFSTQRPTRLIPCLWERDVCLSICCFWAYPLTYFTNWCLILGRSQLPCFAGKCCWWGPVIKFFFFWHKILTKLFQSLHCQVIKVLRSVVQVLTWVQ